MSATPTNRNSPSEETPVTPPRPRIICPGCSTEIAIYQTLGTTEASMYASKVDMGKLGLECQNISCPIYIEGTPNVAPKAVANPNIIHYVQMAKKEADAIEARKKQAQEEAEQRAREKQAAEYAKYDPFSGVQQRLAEDEQLVASQWQRLIEGVNAGLKKQDEEEARRSRKE